MSSDRDRVGDDRRAAVASAYLALRASAMPENEALAHVVRASGLFAA